MDEKAAKTSQDSVYTRNDSSDNRVSNFACLQHEHSEEYREWNGHNHPTDTGGNFSSTNWYYYSNNIISGGLRFFSRKTEMHYRQLDRHIFNPLTQKLDIDDHRHSKVDFFFLYRNVIPIEHPLYEDAKLPHEKGKSKRRREIAYFDRKIREDNSRPK